jgi:hypothetical protein
MEEIDEIPAGFIGAMFGVDCASGDTFVSPGQNISMTSMFVPDPVISLAIIPKDNQAQMNIAKALNRFTKEDPTFRSHVDQETGDTLIEGMGELHLEVYVERMRREYKADVETGMPRVRYRETIKQRADFNYTHKKQTGGAGQFGRVAGYMEPCAEKEFEFENTYLDGQKATSEFEMNYPSIISAGIGYSAGNFDFAGDYRYVSYENTEGFSTSGWTETASVAGFGWENISIVSLGIQFKGIEKLPLRAGYTYNTNPIPDELAFFNAPATAIIQNAFQVGFSFLPSESISIDATYHHGMSSGSTGGPMYNPMFIGDNNPMGMIPGSSVSYDMTTDLIMVGFGYKFVK